MSKRDLRVDRYMANRAPFAQPILKRLRKIIHGVHGLEESIKWGMPAFLYKGKIVCGIAGFKAHCALWFWNSRAVIGKKAMDKDGMGNFGRIVNIKNVPSAAKVKRYVRKGMRLVDQGHSRS